MSGMSGVTMQKTKPIITVMTDFGTEDGYVGAMKGVLLGLLPDAAVVDISHRIEPFNIRQAAFSLLNYAFYYPDNTVHLVVVDPGVGTERKAVIIRTANQYFVGPDNGVFSFIYQQEAFQAYAIRESAFGQEVSSTFHGRDIFAPAAARIFLEKRLESFSEPVTSLVSFYETFRKKSDGEFALQILHVDHYGNLILNFTRRDWIKLNRPKDLKLQLNRGFLYGIHDTFGEAREGQILALWDSRGFLQIARNQGNAATTLDLNVGDQIILRLS